MRHKPITASIINSDLIIAKHISSTLYRHYILNNINTDINAIPPCTGYQRSIYSTNVPNISNQIYLACKKLPSLTYQLRINISDMRYIIQQINNTSSVTIDNNISLNISHSINHQLIQSTFTSSPIQNILPSYANNNHSSQTLIFYIDGSLSKFGQQDIKLFCAWIQFKR
nr:13092_t:CDS:1 [Entrophospora candida]